MKLSTRARYGLRAMIAIARTPGLPATSETVAQQEDVSKKYMDEILGVLREAGLLKAQRGPNGGYALTRPAEEISAVEVVEALEGDIVLVPCLNDAGACTRSKRCPTRPVWQAASKAIRGVLEDLSLAALANSAERIADD